MPIIVCVDGNIGAGKSTLLDELNKRGFIVYREQNIGSDPSDWLWALKNAHDNPKRWACTLQIGIIQSMAVQKKHMDASGGQVIFVERCPASTKVFTQMWSKQGCLTLDELNLINVVYDLQAWEPDITFMLTTTPYECYQRMVQRGRPCEESLTLDYITSVADEYAKLYSTRSFIPLDHKGKVSDVCDRIVNTISNQAVLLNLQAPSHQNKFWDLPN